MFGQQPENRDWLWKGCVEMWTLGSQSVEFGVSSCRARACARREKAVFRIVLARARACGFSFAGEKEQKRTAQKRWLTTGVFVGVFKPGMLAIDSKQIYNIRVLQTSIWVLPLLNGQRKANIIHLLLDGSHCARVLWSGFSKEFTGHLIQWFLVRLNSYRSVKSVTQALQCQFSRRQLVLVLWKLPSVEAEVEVEVETAALWCRWRMWHRVWGSRWTTLAPLAGLLLCLCDQREIPECEIHFDRGRPGQWHCESLGERSGKAAKDARDRPVDQVGFCGGSQDPSQSFRWDPALGELRQWSWCKEKAWKSVAWLSRP